MGRPVHLVVVVGLLALVLAACGSPRDDVRGLPPNQVNGPTSAGPRGVVGAPDPTSDAGVDDVVGARNDVVEGHQAGAMGDITALDADATRMEAYRSGTNTVIRLDSLGPRYWVMTRLTIGADLATLPDGVDYQARGGDALAIPGSGTDVAVPMSVQGCSGPQTVPYTFDGEASSLRLRKEHNSDGSHRVSYTATFANGQSVQAWFDYR